MPSPEEGRPDPDALLAAIAAEEPRGGRGRFKVFLGAAPGVGKTWKMLTQARHHQAQGGDVLAGIIETHDRAKTETQIADFRSCPANPCPTAARCSKSSISTWPRPTPRPVAG